MRVTIFRSSIKPQDLRLYDYSDLDIEIKDDPPATLAGLDGHTLQAIADAIIYNISLGQPGVVCTRKIDAIKRLREATGCGLREAKDFVDRFDFDRS